MAWLHQRGCYCLLQVPCFDYVDEATARLGRLCPASYMPPCSRRELLLGTPHMLLIHPWHFPKSTSAKLSKTCICGPPMAAAGNATHSFEWGREGWRRVVWLKVQVLVPIVEWGFNLVFSDLDTIWLRDPLELFTRHPDAGVALRLQLGAFLTTELQLLDMHVPARLRHCCGVCNLASADWSTAALVVEL
jgi:hypothetical protein